MKQERLIKLLFIALLASVLAAPFDTARARPERHDNSVEFGTWRNYLEGSLGFANAGYDLKADFKKNANFDYKTVAVLGYTYTLGAYSDLALRTSITKNSGSFRASGATNVLLNNIAFGAGGVSNIAADMRFSDFELLASRELAYAERNGFFDLVYGAKFIRLSLDLRDSDFGMENHYLRQLAVPVAGFHAQCRIDDKFKAFAWFYAGRSKADNGASEKKYDTLDLDAGIEYQFKPREPEYTEVGPDRVPEPAPLSGSVEWSVRLGYRERYFRETMGANVIKIDHGGPEIKFNAKF